MKSPAMFVKEQRQPFVLQSEFHAKTTIDVAKISDESIEKKIEHIRNFSLGRDTEKNIKWSCTR
jgi:hypothetical protein